MNKYSLIFVGRNTREIASETLSGGKEAIEWAQKKIQKFCKDRDFTIYYTRVWNSDGKTIFDVGSHSEFFHLIPEVNYENC